MGVEASTGRPARENPLRSQGTCQLIYSIILLKADTPQRTKQPCKPLSARLLKLVVRARLELATYCLEGSCSILMSYRTATLFYNMAHFDVFSTYGGKLCGVYGVTD